MKPLVLIVLAFLFAVSAESSESILGPAKHEAAAGDLGAVLTDQTLPDCLTDKLSSGTDLSICFTLADVSLDLRNCIDAAIIETLNPVTECNL